MRTLAALAAVVFCVSTALTQSMGLAPAEAWIGAAGAAAAIGALRWAYLRRRPRGPRCVRALRSVRVIYSDGSPHGRESVERIPVWEDPETGLVLREVAPVQGRRLARGETEEDQRKRVAQAERERDEWRALAAAQRWGPSRPSQGYPSLFTRGTND